LKFTHGNLFDAVLNQRAIMDVDPKRPPKDDPEARGANERGEREFAFKPSPAA
jgi:hypothetical protein